MKRILLSVMVSCFFWGFAFAQEHPEHPKSETAKKETSKVTTAQMAKAITDYVEKDTKLKGGFFLIYDPTISKSLELKLEKVHEDKLSKVSDTLYFACSDFKATGGKMYDLDFYMQLDESGLTVSEISIHKQDGKPRYNWSQEKGLWVRKPISK